MKFLSLETILLGLNNLRLHKLRSLLTSLGIIFGVAAVICMLSISESGAADEMRLIQLLGTQNIIVNSIKPEESQQSGESQTRLLDYGIKHADVAIIRETVPHVTHIVPLKTVGFRAFHGEYQTQVKTVGTTPEYFEVVNVKVGRGRALAAMDNEKRTNVCVIGDKVRKDLFPFADPLGETILVERYRSSSVPFTVVGVLSTVVTAGSPERGVEERNLNREIYVPFATAMAQFGEIGGKSGSGSRELFKVQYSGLYVSVDETENVLKVSEMIKRVFAHGHRKRDYEVRVPLAQLQLAEKKQRNRQYTLGFIAGISLLVGGIGIMNIMLATVTERTREIGIRRALGARQRHITVQFLVETVVLSTMGGFIGVGLGIAGAHIVSRFAEWQTIVSPWSVLVSFVLSMFVGIFFGLYPAMSAARLDPIEALRHE